MTQRDGTEKHIMRQRNGTEKHTMRQRDGTETHTMRQCNGRTSTKIHFLRTHSDSPCIDQKIFAFDIAVHAWRISAVQKCKTAGSVNRKPKARHPRQLRLRLQHLLPKKNGNDKKR